MPNATERRVAGRYLLRDQLGKGGMGTVWKATDDVLKRQVAVKEVKLPASLSGDDTDAMRRRVMREAQTAARLSHPGAVTVFDVVEEDGHTFIVMELVDAPSLDDLVKSEGALSPQRTAQIGLDVLSALQAAHGQGITHRDVKPANVMIPSNGRAKLADFGIAAVKGDPKLTATGLILGSPSYMAPEQASKDIAGPESDLWALGATLYYAVEGEAPFDRGPAIPTLTAVVHDDPRPMQKAGALEPVITQLLAKEPHDRPSAQRLHSMLEGVISGATSGPTAMAAAPATETMVEDEPAPRPARRTEADRVHSRPELGSDTATSDKPWLVWLGALVLLALLAAFIIPNLGEDETPSDEPNNNRNRNNQAAQNNQQNGENEEAGEGDEPSLTEGEEADDGSGGGPEGFNTYEDSAVGYSISYPSEWDVVPIDTRTDFKEPGSRRYLRIDYTDSPGEDAFGHIEESLEPNFRSRYGDYERVQLTETSFAGSDNAALWEYTYRGQRAYNLQFVTADGAYGFALNFQTSEDEWEDSQPLWETFKETFQLP